MRNHFHIGPPLRRLNVSWGAAHKDCGFLLLFGVNSHCVEFSVHLVWVVVSGYFYWRTKGVSPL